MSLFGKFRSYSVRTVLSILIPVAVTLLLINQLWPQEPDIEVFYWEQPAPEIPPLDLDDFAPDAVDIESDRVFPSLTYGIQTFFWWDEMYRSLGLEHMQLLEFTHIRQVFAWADIEAVRYDADDPRQYLWSYADAMMNDIEAHGIEVVARLGSAPEWAVVGPDEYDYNVPPYDTERLKAYCGAVAERYRGRIAAYQIWNEPNLNREWGGYPPSPAAYATLLEMCANAVRAADPDAIIISAGLAPTGTRNELAMPHDEFLWGMYEAGASPHFDVLGVHAPGYRSAPEADPANLDDGDLPWMSFRHVEYFRAMMIANGDTHKQIAITETGWTIDPRPDSEYHWFSVTPEQQGDYLQRAYLYAAENWRPWVGLITTIYYPNPGWTEDDEEYWWAIGTAAPWPWGLDGRPAWMKLLRMEKISTNPEYSRPARPE